MKAKKGNVKLPPSGSGDRSEAARDKEKESEVEEASEDRPPGLEKVADDPQKQALVVLASLEATRKQLPST
eukprot:12893386-Prorocentrum_lima.AAC.1